MLPLLIFQFYGASIYVEDFLFPVRLFQPGNEISMSILIPEILVQKTKKAITGQKSGM